MANGDYRAQCEKLQEILESESPENIVKFDSVFQIKLDKAYAWKLWAAGYIINGGCSDDCFMDFRSWLIGQGELTFENGIKDPDTLINLKIEPDNWEGLQYCAQLAYKKITQNDLPKSNILGKKEPTGDKWDENNEEQLKKMLPKLYAKFGNQ